MTLGEHQEDWKETRKQLMEKLGEVIETSLRKFGMITVKNRDRQAWGRLVVSSVSEAGRLLRDNDIDDILRRLDILEEREVDKTG